jgi:signal transduction histidine kinase
MATDPTAWSTGFLSALVHELRTPVASLLLTADLLAADPRLDPRHARYARTLEEAAADLQALLDEVGELNRLRAGRVEARRSAVSVEEVLDAALEAVRGTAPSTGPVVVAVRRDGAPETLTTNAPLLARALTALARSALAGGARRVEVRVGFEPGEGTGTARASFDVVDDGDVVAPADVSRFFTPFAPGLSRTRRPHGGTGLGLTIAESIAALLGAELEALAVGLAGPGMTLRLRLPLS